MTQTQSIHKGFNSAQLRITNPTREVNTAKMQASINNGASAVNAGLSEEECAAKALRSLATWDANADGVINSLDPVYRQLNVWQDFNQDGDNTSYKTIGGRSQAAQDERVGNYSQKRSELSPYDDDIGVKKLENWKIEDKTGRKPEKPRACQRTGRRDKQGLQGKKWQCQRHMVILRYEKYNFRKLLNENAALTKTGCRA